ncbi:GxxExxY protein [Alterisphingorhabdus coralli]|uniref:GxxExxY protein n=1 Tax=Alterisphingorhabdus coralli TaxID=3071408 RepID=A0AA97F8A6_9SPHN|nr:GxxExxY protein [Parasphingorhabdus sp. SCSIO 66989]WOE75823.1 GxxExxY protein [Parasphingorhabdus sp. SCSIO 66989]
MRDPEALAAVVIDQAYHLHRDIGPGLLEHVYEAVLADRLRAQNLKVETQKPIAVLLDGKKYDNAFRADLIVNDALLVEIKSLEKWSPVHIKQCLTYIRLLNMPLGLLINFGAATFKEGIKRIMNERVSR